MEQNFWRLEGGEVLLYLNIIATVTPENFTNDNCGFFLNIDKDKDALHKATHKEIKHWNKNIWIVRIK